MAEEHKLATEGEVEVSDRGLFGLGKKKDKEEEVLVTGVEKIKLDEGEEEKKHGILGQLHRSHSSSSSSSDDEGGKGENRDKKKKKKGLKAKMMEKFHKDEEEKKVEEATTAVVVEVPAVGDMGSTAVVAEKLEDATVVETTMPEVEKKGFLDKIKEKLPGHSKKTLEDSTVTAPLSESSDQNVKEGGEKKGFLDKIKEKLPGYHPKSGGEESKKTNVGH